MIFFVKAFLIIILTSALAFPAAAAELAAISDPRCDHLLSGDINENDADLFKDVPVYRLCLDSQGGSFLGGWALSGLFMADGIQTYIRRGDQCHSACAIAFLGGSAWGDMRHASRTLEPGAVLGFHAPFLALPPGKHDAEELNHVVMLAMEVARQIVGNASDLKISSSFMTEFLLYPSLNTKVVTTVHDAVMAGIEVQTPYKLPKIGNKDARQACKTLFDRYSSAFADGVTATKPIFDVKPSGDFSKALSVTTDVDGENWMMAATVHSDDTPWQSSACAFSDYADSWGYREAVVWSNDRGSEPDLTSAHRRVRLRIPDWYFLPGETLLNIL